MILNYKNLFNYEIVRNKKRHRTISIKVSNGIATILSPINTADIFLTNLLEKNKEKICNKILNQTIPKEENKLSFLGQIYDINTIDNKLLKNHFIELTDNKFIINRSSYTNFDQDMVIKKWYKEQCLKNITNRIKYFINNYHFNFDIKINKIRVKNQISKWGSCSSKHNLNFNYKIIEKSQDVIDYLVVHELSHTVHMNHSKEFWNYVKNILPNYLELRQQLK